VFGAFYVAHLVLFLLFVFVLCQKPNVVCISGLSIALWVSNILLIIYQVDANWTTERLLKQEILIIVHSVDIFAIFISFLFCFYFINILEICMKMQLPLNC
jgi:hypothetical protein